MKNYDPTKPLKYIEYLDKNNLYGWIMSRYLPHGRFSWLKHADKFDVISISKNISAGYILEVGLEYPDELQVLHNYYSLAPEKLAFSCDMLSDYCEKIADKHGVKFDDVKESIPNICDKTNYVLHYTNFQLYLSLGVRLTKIYKVLKFKQPDWTKIYIDFNMKKKMLLIVLEKTFLN